MKSKLEKFSQYHDCLITIEIEGGRALVFITKKDQIYREGFGGDNLQKAIDNAINAFLIRGADEAYNRIG